MGGVSGVGVNRGSLCVDDVIMWVHVWTIGNSPYRDDVNNFWVVS